MGCLTTETSRFLWMRARSWRAKALNSNAAMIEPGIDAESCSRVVVVLMYHWNPTPGEPVNNTVTMMFQPYPRLNYETFRLRAITGVPREILSGFMQPSGFTPNMIDVVIRNGIQYAVEFINEVKTANTLLYYEVLLVR